MRKTFPTTRRGWAGYYIKLFENSQGAQRVGVEKLAMWYLILAEAEDSGDL